MSDTYYKLVRKTTLIQTAMANTRDYLTYQTTMHEARYRMNEILHRDNPELGFITPRPMSSDIQVMFDKLEALQKEYREITICMHAVAGECFEQLAKMYKITRTDIIALLKKHHVDLSKIEAEID